MQHKNITNTYIQHTGTTLTFQNISKGKHQVLYNKSYIRNAWQTINWKVYTRYTDTIIQFTDNTENSKQYGKHKEKQNDPWTSLT